MVTDRGRKNPRCAWAIIHELHKHHPRVILDHMRAISPLTLVVALGLTALNYVF
jgi:hypothetical protein